MKKGTETTLDRLRAVIHAELDRCDPGVTPGVCARLRSAGYLAVEEDVINLVVGQGIIPSAAIALLDSEWS